MSDEYTNEPMMHSVRRISMLANALESKDYLEIGVCDGTTFLNVDMARKVGVDPNFCFDTSSVSSKDAALHEMTSDAYFTHLDKHQKFDIIFLDGLHTFEQTYRDLCNALMHSTDDTVIIIDDILPVDVYSAIPDQSIAIKRRRESGYAKHRAWHGDVYKMAFAIHDFHHGLNYQTILGSGNPQMLIWASKSFRRDPLLNNFEQISRFSYFQLLDHMNILRPADEDVAIAMCLNELQG